MKRFILVLILALSVSGLFAERKTLYKNTRGLSSLYLYEITTEEDHYFLIYAEELKDVGNYNKIKIKSYDKQKLSDIILFFLDNGGLQRKFEDNINKLNLELVDKNTEFMNASKIITHYNYFVE